MKKIVLAAMACIALAGCVTTAVSVSQSAPVPDERVLAYKNRADGAATLTVIRDSGFTGGGCYLALYVNGQLTARMDTAERVDLAVPVGELVLGVSRDKQGGGLCKLGDQWIQRETVMKAGDRKVFRITTDRNKQFDIFRSNE